MDLFNLYIIQEIIWNSKVQLSTAFQNPSSRALLLRGQHMPVLLFHRMDTSCQTSVLGFVHPFIDSEIFGTCCIYQFGVAAVAFIKMQ